MISRRKTRQIRIGPVTIGSRHPIAIQSMTKVFTTDTAACIRQVQRLREAGCDLVRIAVPTRKDTEALARIIEQVDVPIIADIHFSAQRAIEALEAGAAKIRLNPGNVKDPGDLVRVIDCAKAHKAAIRIGVNEASIRDLKAADVPESKRVALMLREIKQYVRIFERRGFERLVLSAKSADPVRTIEINRAIAGTFDYPIRIGLTHAGLPEDAAIPSAVSLGALLSEGIGDTIRVSIAGDPVREVHMAQQILKALHLFEDSRPELIVCPTCGRCRIDVVRLAQKVRQVLEKLDRPLRVAVMGCIVNGPGEAADADIAVCAAEGKGFLYRFGRQVAVVEESQLIEALRSMIEQSPPNTERPASPKP